MVYFSGLRYPLKTNFKAGSYNFLKLIFCFFKYFLSYIWCSFCLVAIFRDSICKLSSVDYICRNYMLIMILYADWVEHRLCKWTFSVTCFTYALSLPVELRHRPPCVGLRHPSSPLSIYFLIFSPFYFFLSFIGFTYFLFLSIPSLSTRIVPLRFQAGGRRRRPKLGLVCIFLCFTCVICIP